MYYNIKIKSRDSELGLDSNDKAITQREMDLYFALIFGASEEFVSDIKKVELKHDNLKSISVLEGDKKDEEVTFETQVIDEPMSQNTVSETPTQTPETQTIVNQTPTEAEPQTVTFEDLQKLTAVQKAVESENTETPEVLSIKNLKEKSDIFGKINRKEIFNTAEAPKKIDFEDIDALNSEIALLNARKAELERLTLTANSMPIQTPTVADISAQIIPSEVNTVPQVPETKPEPTAVDPSGFSSEIPGVVPMAPVAQAVQVAVSIPLQDMTQPVPPVSAPPVSAPAETVPIIETAPVIETAPPVETIPVQAVTQAPTQAPTQIPSIIETVPPAVATPVVDSIPGIESAPVIDSIPPVIETLPAVETAPVIDEMPIIKQEITPAVENVIGNVESAPTLDTLDTIPVIDNAVIENAALPEMPVEIVQPQISQPLPAVNNIETKPTEFNLDDYKPMGCLEAQNFEPTKLADVVTDNNDNLANIKDFDQNKISDADVANGITSLKDFIAKQDDSVISFDKNEIIGAETETPTAPETSVSPLETLFDKQYDGQNIIAQTVTPETTNPAQNFESIPTLEMPTLAENEELSLNDTKLNITPGEEIDYSQFNNKDLNDIFSYDDSLRAMNEAATPTPAAEADSEIPCFVPPQDETTLPAVAAVPVQATEIEQLPSIEEITKALEPEATADNSMPVLEDDDLTLSELKRTIEAGEAELVSPCPAKLLESNEEQEKTLSFSSFLQSFECDDIYDEFLGCTYYTKHVLKQSTFSIKSVNAKLYQASGKIADMAVVNTLLEKEYIKVKTEGESNTYQITVEGEDYFQNKLKL